MNAYQKELDEREYEEYLNDAYAPVVICGYTYEQGTALKELDPTAFNCDMVDHNGMLETWFCGECNCEYDTEEEAEECCSDES